MRTLRIDKDLSITEIDVEPSEWKGGDEWDATRVDGSHYAWVRDDGLFMPGLAVANIGEAKRMPLPAYVMGVDAGRTVPATIDVEALRTLIT